MRSALAGLALACAGCDRGQLVVVVDTDLRTPDELDQIQLTVLGPAGETVSHATLALAGGAATLPGTLGLDGRAGATSVTIRAVGLRNGTEVIRREVQTTFASGPIGRVDVPLLAGCLGVACPAGQTCRVGDGCVAPAVDATTLPTWTGAPPPLDPGPATGIAAGAAHTCVVRARGDVACWGQNLAGQLGDGTQVDRAAPVVVRGVPDAVAVTAGVFFSCALRRSGAVACWGDDHGGELGDSATMHDGCTFDPGGSPLGCSTTATAVAGSDVADALAAGGYFTLAHLTDGSVAVWGQNNHGNLGIGLSPPGTYTRLAPVPLPGASSVAEVAAATWHGCLRRADGSVACWGLNARGAVGAGAPVDSVACCGTSSACVAGQNAPVAVPGIANAVALGLGGGTDCAYATSRSCAVLGGGGGARCWGDDAHGELDGVPTAAPVATPVALPLSFQPARIWLGSAHLCATDAQGALWCWGANDEGQRGDGGDAAPLGPAAAVMVLPDAVSVGLGGAHSCAVRRSGAVACWGAGGLVGDGTDVARPLPVDVRAAP